MKLYHGTNYSSAMDIVENGICLERSKKFLDFGAGFYTTPSYTHAASVAIRTTDKINNKKKIKEEPYIVEVDYKPIKDLDLSEIAYPRHSEKWGQFVLNNRLEEDILDEYNIIEHNRDAKYDVCYGEIADGSIVNLAYEVNHKLITVNDVDYQRFLKDDGSVYPQQYSFHTAKAISCIKVLSCDIIKNKEKYIELMRKGSR